MSAADLIAPAMPDWNDLNIPAYSKAVVDRIKFDFALDRSTPSDEALRPEDITLPDKDAFEEWLKCQRSLQNWNQHDRVDMQAEARSARESYAAKRESAGSQYTNIVSSLKPFTHSQNISTESAPRKYKREAPASAAMWRTIFKCDHAKILNMRRGNGKRLKLKPTIKVNCKAKMVVHEMADGSFKVHVDGVHTNHSASKRFYPHSLES